MSIDLLWPGDVALATAKHGDPIGETVRLIDCSDYSHAVLLENRVGNDFFCFSANQQVGDLFSGVNRIRLSALNHSGATGRGLKILRHGDPLAAERAVVEARRWAHDKCSDFGWEQIVLSAGAGLARHVKPGLARSLLTRFVRGASAMFLPECPRPWGNPQPNGWLADRWDCCQFIDHVLSTPTEPLGTIEADPAPGRYEWRAVLAKVLELWQGEMRDRLCAGKLLELPDPDMDEVLAAFEEEDLEQPERLSLRELLELIHCIRQRFHSEAICDGDHSTVWPAFSSPRLLWKETPAVGFVVDLPPKSLDPR